MSDTNWTFTSTVDHFGDLRRWWLRGPNGIVKFEIAIADHITIQSVHVHAVVPPVGCELEPCELCGKCWHDSLSGERARKLRERWEGAGFDDAVIREHLERWYNEELSTPVPVSEGSQVSGEEVGPGANGPNLAATGAGTGLGGVVPVPVVAQPEPYGDLIIRKVDPRYFVEEAPPRALLALEVLLAAGDDTGIYISRDIAYIGEDYEGNEVAYQVTGWEPQACALVIERRADLDRAILPHLSDDKLAWGSGPLVDHNPETPAGAKPRVPVAGSPTAAGAREADPASLGLGAGSAAPDGSRYPAKYGYCAQCGAEPGQSCHYMFGDGTANQEPNSVRPEPHFYRDSPGDDPNWRNLSAYKGSGTGSADPDGGQR